MSDGRLVVGRVVGLDGGRQAIVPIGPNPTNERLVKAARRYRDKPNEETLAELKAAARAIV